MALILSVALAGAAVMVLAAPRTHAHAAGQVALNTPLADHVPPGVKLTIGDPATRLVLEHTGWIKQLPFQVKWAQITGGPGVIEAFHAKVLDVGSVADMPPIHATWIGMPVKMIAVRLRQDPVGYPLFELAVGPKSKIATLADLKGKKIAYSPGQAQGEIMLRTLKAEGLTPKDVTLVELPSTAADVYINALAAGLVDIAPIGAGAPARRYLDQYAEQGGKMLRHPPFRDDLLTLFVRDETLQDPGKAAALAAYVRLWARANQWIQDHPDEWARIYFEKDQGLSPDQARDAVAATGRLDIPRDWRGAEAMQQAAIDIMAPETGRPRFDATELFDWRFQTLAADAVAPRSLALAQR